jgi:hypothetical protein
MAWTDTTLPRELRQAADRDPDPEYIRYCLRNAIRRASFCCKPLNVSFMRISADPYGILMYAAASGRSSGQGNTPRCAERRDGIPFSRVRGVGCFRRCGPSFSRNEMRKFDRFRSMPVERYDASYPALISLRATLRSLRRLCKDGSRSRCSALL